jgi:Protein of unknown function (DUF664)
MTEEWTAPEVCHFRMTLTAAARISKRSMTRPRPPTLARATLAQKQLADVVPSRGHHPERTRDIRGICPHMIEEYARHNGHADLLRERIDGATGT